MDILGRIDSTLEAWERGPDAMRWTPEGGESQGKGISVATALSGQAFFAPAGTPAPDATTDVLNGLNGWTDIGTTTEGVTLSGPLPDPGWVHMVNCPDCDNNVGESRALVFPTQEKRWEWIGAHRQATGHGTGRMTSIRRDAITFER